MHVKINKKTIIKNKKNNKNKKILKIKIKNLVPNNCSCTSGYTGINCLNFTCADINNCNNRGNCIGPNECVCSPGYTGATCLIFDCSASNNCGGAGKGSCVGKFLILQFKFFIFLLFYYFIVIF